MAKRLERMPDAKGRPRYAVSVDGHKYGFIVKINRTLWRGFDLRFVQASRGATRAECARNLVEAVDLRA